MAWERFEGLHLLRGFGVGDGGPPFTGFAHPVELSGRQKVAQQVGSPWVLGKKMLTERPPCYTHKHSRSKLVLAVTNSSPSGMNKPTDRGPAERGGSRKSGSRRGLTTIPGIPSGLSKFPRSRKATK